MDQNKRHSIPMYFPVLVDKMGFKGFILHKLVFLMTTPSLAIVLGAKDHSLQQHRYAMHPIFSAV